MATAIDNGAVVDDTASLIRRLIADNEALKARINGAGRAFKLKVSEKGAVSMYGLGRFPVTL